LLEEVKRLREKGYKEALHNIKTVGYYELNQYLKGKLSKEEAIEEIKQNTRQYAKRQISWFRNQTDTHWIDFDNKSKSEIVKAIIQIYKEYNVK
ncbi:MAG: tRNA (adenosine(37)-N6)-dimethylallyltransferase MiaA, partial [Candidatus Marinimicrobia bacterium]|nr:tRNA (adenosine(37)-N6)-dimethylallyltransferase MiaA [Candidatus Neomarinimicrobiota bacterium]